MTRCVAYLVCMLLAAFRIGYGYSESPDIIRKKGKGKQRKSASRNKTFSTLRDVAKKCNACREAPYTLDFNHLTDLLYLLFIVI